MMCVALVATLATWCVLVFPTWRVRCGLTWGWCVAALRQVSGPVSMPSLLGGAVLAKSCNQLVVGLGALGVSQTAGPHLALLGSVCVDQVVAFGSCCFLDYYSRVNYS